MTADETRAAYLAVIGAEATAQLEAAGLLPTGVESRMVTESDEQRAGRRTVVWVEQTRYVTAWTLQAETVNAGLQA